MEMNEFLCLEMLNSNGKCKWDLLMVQNLICYVEWQKRINLRLLYLQLSEDQVLGSSITLRQVVDNHVIHVLSAADCCSSVVAKASHCHFFFFF